ncbi:MAG: hypothetical protein KKB03_00625 [Nanoarchaeota archaeon]|nr:hypothetical protein [Nanoarchaeota archaeon]MBU1135150.1 hypothetical protein [Nanoarchaeota archaeon]MBU2519733.1 hypothetical protein [Nanoarchaeota archaeon]
MASEENQLVKHLEGWDYLADNLNNAPIEAGDYTALFQNVGDEKNYMLLFRLPDLTDEQFKVKFKYNGETSGDYIDIYSLDLEGPVIDGYRLVEHIDYKIVTERFSTHTGKLGLLPLVTGAMIMDDFILAFGEAGINSLVDGKVENIPIHVFDPKPYRVHVIEALKKL